VDFPDLPVAPIPAEIAEEALTRGDFRWHPSLDQDTRFGYYDQRAVSVHEVLLGSAIPSGGGYTGSPHDTLHRGV